MDFVSDSLSGVRWLKYLSVAAVFSHESVDIAVDDRSSRHSGGRSIDSAAIWHSIGAKFTLTTCFR